MEDNKNNKQKLDECSLFLSELFKCIDRINNLIKIEMITFDELDIINTKINEHLKNIKNSCILTFDI